MLSKNDYVEIKIEALGAEGEGIGRIAGMAVFVEGGIPGDLLEILIVKTKKTYCYGKLIKIIAPSPDRVEPVCPVFRRCGGCVLQHMEYPKQLEYKQNKVSSALQRIGGLSGIPVERTIGMETPFFYRNKAQFPISRTDGRVTVGFYAKRSHMLIPVKKCYIQSDICESILGTVEDFANEFSLEPYDENTHTGLLRHVLIRTGCRSTSADDSPPETMVCLVINGDGLPHEDELTKRLSSNERVKSIVVNSNTDRTNVITGKGADSNQVLYGGEYITARIGNLSFRISPLSFFQVNPIQTKVLYDKIAELAKITKDETVFDLYCGVGAISLYVSGFAKMVYGIESVPEAVSDAVLNASLNNITNAEFLHGQAEDLINELIVQRGIKPDIVITDPPRKGCTQELLHAFIEYGIGRIIYVSCDPATLSRDLKILTDAGYRIEAVQPVDCFPQTNHVETVVLLSGNHSMS